MERTKTLEQIHEQYWRIDRVLSNLKFDMIFDNSLPKEKRDAIIQRAIRLSHIAYGIFIRYTENIAGILGQTRPSAVNAERKKAFDRSIAKGKSQKEANEIADFMANQAGLQYDRCSFDVSEYTNDNNGDTPASRPLGRYAIVNEVRTECLTLADHFRRKLGNTSI